MQNGNKPFLAIWMVTYNHQNWIDEALTSILQQRTYFRFKLFIGEDCSTDSTLEIIRIKLSATSIDYEIITRSKNIGPNANALEIYRKCFDSGAKYIAMLEGDDFWTDPYKLQKQVDFLEANPEYSICFHPVNVLKDSNISEDNLKKVPETTSIEDLSLGNYIHTPSVVFRNNLFKEFPHSFSLTPAGDYFLHLLNARHGKIRKLDDAMAVYRMHDSGIWSKRSQVERELNWIKQLSLMLPEFKEFPLVMENLEYQMHEIFKRILRKTDSDKPSLEAGNLSNNVDWKILLKALRLKATKKLKI